MCPSSPRWWPYPPGCARSLRRWSARAAYRVRRARGGKITSLPGTARRPTRGQGTSPRTVGGVSAERHRVVALAGADEVAIGSLQRGTSKARTTAGHGLLERPPEWPSIMIGAGCSGHDCTVTPAIVDHLGRTGGKLRRDPIWGDDCPTAPFCTGILPPKWPTNRLYDPHKSGKLPVPPDR